jgi:ubiquinone biosynthesis protein
MELNPLARPQRNLVRLAEIIKILARYGLADWLRKVQWEEVRRFFTSPEGPAIADLPMPVRLRLALTELGTTFIKLGQVLSTRPDLVGPEIAAELRQLQTDTPPDSPEVVRRNIESELGAPPEELYGFFDDVPLASASIGQVYQARLPTGEQVVIKVQHDHIIETVNQDLDLMHLLAEWMQEHLAAARPYQPPAIFREFRRTLLRELDFACERRNLEQFGRNFGDDDGVHFPEVYPELCSRRILTMELLEGIPGTSPDELQHAGVDLNEFAQTAANMYLNMIFRDGFYHADPHPGNFMMLPDGRLGVLDCGMVGRITEQLRDSLDEIILAIAQRDEDALTDVVVRVGSVPPQVDRLALESELTDFVAEHGGQSLKDVSLGHALQELGEIIRRHQIVLPSGISLLLKTMVVLEGTAKQLSPKFSLANLLESYQGKLLQHRLLPQRWLRKVRRTQRDWSRLAVNAPRDLADILERLRTGKLEMRHEHQHLERTMNRLTTGILSAALFLSSALLLSRVSGGWLGRLMFVLAVLCLMAAIWLGWSTVRDIRKSERRQVK